MKKPAPLPKELRFLQPFVEKLAKLPPEELNEDVDASRLETILRKRVRGLDIAAAETKLTEDRELLEEWLKPKPDHPAYWVLGYLLLPDLATHLIKPPKPPPRGPNMTFDAPPGWKVTPVPFRLDLKRGKVIGSIMAIEKSTFELLQFQRKNVKLSRDLKAAREILDVRFGKARGKKTIFLQAKPVPWKTVDYLMTVPGGFVNISLGTTTGAIFDESSFESKLGTLRLSKSKKLGHD